ncbi:hypothetical protein AMAG_02809 [Allomyces macrogynus ATCC 38327]|uniref:PCI domain-containing protein n=1 Tax=Allomyces macrogynus (strain ATCC 38327) TaxID=578462 RepID=A0A0L0S3S4_ALLM3|nr:hypothetical protein AMAG_02809 [Allomyces macrogynus ATCC 38327]|eukprot:KNE57050.1 hypothetical protein AMAG_02809 [Allomyces macrogynus ATCC 38327]
MTTATAPAASDAAIPPKLLPFVLLAKSTRGAAAADLVAKVLEAPGVYVFSEFLSVPSIQQLKETHKGAFDLLTIFAYRDLAAYKASAVTLPPLTPPMQRKLRLLTLITLAQTARELPYATLLTALDYDPSALRDLEDLIIEGMSEQLFSGTLDQRARVLHVESAIGRDVSPEMLGAMVDRLEAWSATTTTVLDSIQQQIEHARMVAAAHKAANDAFQEKVKAAEEKKAAGRGPRGMGSSSGPMAMEL